MKLYRTLLSALLPVVVLARSSLVPALKNNTDDSLKRLKRCYSNGGYYNYNGYYNPCCYSQYNRCQPSPCYSYYDPCSTQPPTTYPPGTYPPATYPPATYPPVTYPPVTYPPTYWPIWPTVSPYPTRPPYTPIWPTVSPNPTRPPYTPIWPTVSPIPTGPPYTPIWPTVSPNPTRPTYIPIWQTVSPNPTRPPYTPIWPTVSPNPTRPTYIPIGPTVSPYPTPIWQTRTPVPTTRPAYTPIWQTRTPFPTYIPIGQTRTPYPTTRPPYTPIWQTRPVNPTRPTYIPIGQTVDPIITRPAFVPILHTKPPKTERLSITYDKDSEEDTAAKKVYRTSITGEQGCTKACIDEHQTVYCCENENSVCPVIGKDFCEKELEGLSVREHFGDKCTIDSHCQANNKCCYNFCDDEYYCMNVQEWNLKSQYAVQNYPQYDRLERHTGNHHLKPTLTIVFPAESNDSMALLENLTSIVDEFQNYVTFNLLPIETQVGASESSESLGMGEIIQCAANQNPDQKNLVKLTVCLMSSDLHPTTKVKDAQSAARRCGRHAGYRWRDVSTCLKEKKGRQLLIALRWDYRDLLNSLQQKQLTSIFYGSPIMALNGTVLSTPPQISIDWLTVELCKHFVHLPDIPSICESVSQPLTNVENR